MTKKHFIALAECLRNLRPVGYVKHGSVGSISEHHDAEMAQWNRTRNALGDFCQSQNPHFDRDRWLAYIAGKGGPNGGRK